MTASMYGIFILISLTPIVLPQEYNGFRVVRKLFDQCASREELFKCLKIQAIKVTDRALSVKHLDILEGLSIVRNGRTARSLPLNESKLEKLDSSQLDSLLGDRTTKFLETHQLEVSVPKLVEEGRGKKKKGNNNNYGALYWALAIKGSFLAMAYQGIAVMSGLALIIGKMALLLAAILGLKKLVNGNREKTTFEIIKQPKYTSEHIHTTSHEDEGHHFKRMSYDDDIQRRIYKYQIPI